MKLVCLGTTGFHPTEERHTPCFMIPDLGVVFDCGTGFFRVPKLIKTEIIDVFLSHAHMDHVAGIPSVDEIYSTTGCKRVRFHGEKQVLEAVKILSKPPFFPVPINIEWVPLEEGKPVELENGAVISHFPLKHRGISIGYKIEYKTSSFAYVTDTNSNGNSEYIKNIEGVAVLAHEMFCCSLNHESASKMGHTSTIGLSEFVKKAKPGRVIAIHHDPSGNLKNIEKEGKEMIEGLIYGTDGLEIDL